MAVTALLVGVGGGSFGCGERGGDLIGAPHPQRHRGEDHLEPVAVGGGEQPQGAPFAWLQRRAPQAQQMSLGRELARVGGLVVRMFWTASSWCSVRDAGGHADEVFDGQAPPGLLQTL